MIIASTMKTNPLRALALKSLRAVHEWSGRCYRRALLRQEWARVGRNLIESSRSQRPPPIEAQAFETETSRRRQKGRKAD
jgi:hypothetical protein